MKYVVVKMSPVSFVGNDGVEVHGQYFYLKPCLGGPVMRIFMTSDAILRLSAVPDINDCVYLVQNGAGKVVDMIEEC